MRYCKRCVIPDTRPGITFNENGVCSACVHHEQRKQVDWKKRLKELEKLCDKYRREDGYYDCIVAVSPGKDSYYQVYVMKEKMRMNPLLLNVYNFDWTEAGLHNLNNLSEAFGCDLISLHLNRRLAKKMLRVAFEEFGSPTWYWDRAVYVWPVQMSIKLGIPLVVYGENVNYEYGGSQQEETYSAREQINNDVAKSIPLDFWLGKGVQRKELNPIVYPPLEKIEKAGVEPIYISYFTPWDEVMHLRVAKRYGFRTLAHEWDREGHFEDWKQIDAVSYLVHPWLKYPKFGHRTATDVACRLIRDGYITREEGIKLVKEHDSKLDQRALQAFLDFTGYTTEEFWKIVDKFYNRDIFEWRNEGWVLKDPIWAQEKPRKKQVSPDTP
jgi:N-acetyl sugar amidotransferase